MIRRADKVDAVSKKNAPLSAVYSGSWRRRIFHPTRSIAPLDDFSRQLSRRIDNPNANCAEAADSASLFSFSFFPFKSATAVSLFDRLDVFFMLDLLILSLNKR